MPRIARPLFKRHGEYVAVRNIANPNGDDFKPGDDVKLRPHHMRSLYMRRRIGPKGHPWTEQALASKKFPLGFTSPNPRTEPTPPPADPAKIELPDPVKDERPWIVSGTTDRFKTKGEATAWIDENNSEDETKPEAEKDGLIWAVENRDVRFAKKAEAAEWIKENYVATKPKEGE